MEYRGNQGEEGGGRGSLRKKKVYDGWGGGAREGEKEADRVTVREASHSGQARTQAPTRRDK